jgi:hypothetical protein
MCQPDIFSGIDSLLIPRPADPPVVDRKIAEVTAPVPVTQARDSDAVMSVARSYYAHHFQCRFCVAAGGNPTLSRCTDGLSLWGQLIRVCDLSSQR